MFPMIPNYHAVDVLLEFQDDPPVAIQVGTVLLAIDGLEEGTGGVRVDEVQEYEGLPLYAVDDGAGVAEWARDAD